MVRQATTLVFLVVLLGFSGWAAVVAADSLPEPAALWFDCQQSEDCTVVRGTCSYPAAVNGRYRSEYETWIQSNPPAHCAVPAPAARMCITCRESRCMVETERRPPNDSPPPDGILQPGEGADAFGPTPPQPETLPAP